MNESKATTKRPEIGNWFGASKIYPYNWTKNKWTRYIPNDLREMSFNIFVIILFLHSTFLKSKNTPKEAIATLKESNLQVISISWVVAASSLL